jgi:hypothetical protein
VALKYLKAVEHEAHALNLVGSELPAQDGIHYDRLLSRLQNGCMDPWLRWAAVLSTWINFELRTMASSGIRSSAAMIRRWIVFSAAEGRGRG